MFTSANGLPQRLIILLAFCCGVTTHAHDFAGGAGEPNDPYQIATAEQLISIGSDPNLLDKHFILLNDLDLDPNLPGGRIFSRAIFAPSEEYLSRRFAGNPFTGAFDGMGHVIRNLTIARTITDDLGLFGAVGACGEVRNLGLEDVRISAAYSERVGALAGTNLGTIRHCYATGSASGFGFVGGLVGRASGTLIDSHASVHVSVGTRGYLVGGLAGTNSGTIVRCYATGEVSGGVNSWSLGGLVGSNSGQIITCCASGAVFGESSAKEVGGLVGDNYKGVVSDSYACAGISAGARSGIIGGFVGANSGVILHCYAVGAIHADDTCTPVGGLAAQTTGGEIHECFWDVETTGLSESIGGRGLTTAAMWDIGTFLAAGWDFTGETRNGPLDVWAMPEASGYPTLAFLSDAYVSPTLAGAGTPQDPFRIASAGELSIVRYYDPCACYKLTNDIDLSGITWPAAPIPEFDGMFEGGGHTISHLTIRGLSNLALFGELGPQAVVTDLRVEDANIVGTDEACCVSILAGDSGGSIFDCSASGIVFAGIESEAVGGLAGRSRGQIDGCHITGDIHSGAKSRYSGGLVGISYGVIANCSATAAVSGGEDAMYLGCLVGSNNGPVSNCHADGSVSGEAGSRSVGGLIGENVGGTVLGSHATVHVSNGSNGVRAGGLVGSNGGVIDDSYALGPVSSGDGSRSVGGLLGSNGGMVIDSHAIGPVSCGAGSAAVGGFVGSHGGSIADCWASGEVAGSIDSNMVGGFAGESRFGAIANCYAIGKVSVEDGSTNLGGFIGHNYGGIRACFWNVDTSGVSESAGGTGLSIAQMHSADTFVSAGWDMVDERTNGTADSWRMPDGTGYPMLTSFWEAYQPHLLEGAGTPGEPYRIADAQDLGAMRHYDPAACYELTADIDLSAITWGSAPIAYFSGAFHGSDFSVSHLMVRGTGRLGLFALLTEQATVQDLAIEDANIVSSDRVLNLGVLAATNGGTIARCHTNGSLTGGYQCGWIGGLVGNNVRHARITGCSSTTCISAGGDSICLGGLVGINQGEITDCRAVGDVSGGDQSRCLGGLVGLSYGTISGAHAGGVVTGGDTSRTLGGLAGWNEASISHCRATGAVIGGEACTELGGLVGFMGVYRYDALGDSALVPGGTISDCSAADNVTAGSGSSKLGGLVGLACARMIERCCATGNISAGTDANDLGGLVGLHRGNCIRDSYAMGSIWGDDRGTNFGGLVGEIPDSWNDIASCYAAGSVSAGVDARHLGGLAGGHRRKADASYFLAPSDGGGPDNGFGVPLTDEQMKQQASFIGWDFENVWMICEGKGYPRLRWERVQCRP